MIFGSTGEFAAACAIVALAQFVYVVLGFGSGLIAVGLLALVIPDVRDVVVLLLLVNLPAEAWIVMRSRGAIDWRGVSRIAFGVALGIPIGTWILKAGDSSAVLAGLGASLIAVGVVFARLGDGGRVAWPRWVDPPVGVVSGTLTGLFGTGGPPLIVYFHLRGISKAAFRGNLMALFLLKTFVRVPAYAVGDLLSAPRLWSGLALLPAVVVGAWAGNRVHLELPEARFRRLVAGALVVIGAILLSRQLGAG